MNPTLHHQDIFPSPSAEDQAAFVPFDRAVGEVGDLFEGDRLSDRDFFHKAPQAGSQDYAHAGLPFNLAPDKAERLFNFLQCRFHIKRLLWRLEEFLLRSILLDKIIHVNTLKNLAPLHFPLNYGKLPKNLAIPGPEARPRRAKTIRRFSLHGTGGPAILFSVAMFFLVGAPGWAPIGPASICGNPWGSAEKSLSQPMLLTRHGLASGPRACIFHN
jgi:hypothetical protein